MQSTVHTVRDRTMRDTDNGANKDDGEVLRRRTVNSQSSNWRIPAMRQMSRAPSPT